MRNPITSRHAPPYRTLKMTALESALLYNLLCDNARGWNKELREQLRQVVTPTQALNARIAVKEGEV